MNAQRYAALAGMTNIMAVGNDVADAKAGLVPPVQPQFTLVPLTPTVIFLEVNININGEATVHDCTTPAWVVRVNARNSLLRKANQPYLSYSGSESGLTPGIDCFYDSKPAELHPPVELT